MKGGMFDAVTMVWNLLLFSGLFAAYYIILNQFISGLDTLTQVFMILLGLSLIAAVVFIPRHRSELRRRS